MICIVAKCEVDKKNLPEFEQLAREMEKKAKKAPGNISYQIVKNRNKENDFAFFEQWNDTDVLHEFFQTDCFQTITPQICKLVNGQIDAQTFETLQ